MPSKISLSEVINIPGLFHRSAGISVVLQRSPVITALSVTNRPVYQSFLVFFIIFIAGFSNAFADYYIVYPILNSTREFDLSDLGKGRITVEKGGGPIVELEQGSTSFEVDLTSIVKSDHIDVYSGVLARGSNEKKNVYALFSCVKDDNGKISIEFAFTNSGQNLEVKRVVDLCS